MTHEEAARILDPETSREALAGIGYYGGFRGEDAVLEAVNDACRIAAEVLRSDLLARAEAAEAENTALRKMQPVRLDDTGAQALTLAAEVSELRKKLEAAEDDNKKLCAAMMQLKRTDRPERNSVVYALEYDSSLSHKTTEEVAGIVFSGLMDADLKLRGQKED